MTIVYGNVENIIWGEDGEFPFEAYIERVKAEAKHMKAHFKIRILTKEKKQKDFVQKSLYMVNRNKDTTQLGEKTISKIKEVIPKNFDGQIKIDFIHSSKPEVILASLTRKLRIEKVQKKGKTMAYADFDKMIFDENNQNSSLRSVINRCIENAKEDGNRLRIEIRSKALGTTTSRQEHSFSTDANKSNVKTIMNTISERLKSSPSEDFAGEIRLNFYAHGQATIKYGSFTRQIKEEFNFEDEEHLVDPKGYNDIDSFIDFLQDGHGEYEEYDYGYPEIPDLIDSQKSLIQTLEVVECLREENATLNKRIDTLLTIITNLTKR